MRRRAIGQGLRPLPVPKPVAPIKVTNYMSALMTAEEGQAMMARFAAAAASVTPQIQNFARAASSLNESLRSQIEVQTIVANAGLPFRERLGNVNKKSDLPD